MVHIRTVPGAAEEPITILSTPEADGSWNAFVYLPDQAFHFEIDTLGCGGKRIRDKRTDAQIVIGCAWG